MYDLKDIEIVRSVLEGNHSDFAILVNRYKDRGFNLLRRMLRNQQDAEEVLQDSFMKAYRSLNSFRGDAKFSTWFYRIVYNSALTFLDSKRKRDERLLSSLEDFGESVTGEESIRMQPGDDVLTGGSQSEYERADTMNFIEKVIEKLPEKHSAIITMFYVNEMSIEEISKATDLGASNIKVMLHRARISLRELIISRNYQEDVL